MSEFTPTVPNPCDTCKGCSECHACKFFVEWVYTTRDEVLPIISEEITMYGMYYNVLDPYLPGCCNPVYPDDVNVILDNRMNIVKDYRE